MATNNTNATTTTGKEPVMVAPTVAKAPIVNTTQTGARLSEADVKRDLEKAQKELGAKKLKTVSIPKQLASVLGDTLPACIQGVCINVPVDGNEYEVPEPYVELIRNSLKTINSGDVRANLANGANDEFLIVKK